MDMRQTLFHMTVLGASLLVMLAGCSSDSGGTRLTPDDFVRRGHVHHDAATPSVMATNEGGASSEAPGPTQSGSDTSRTQPDSGNVRSVGQRSYTMDVMVGEVNGQSIYASRILAPFHEQFSVWGEQLSQSDFVHRAQPRIASRVYLVIRDALLIGEAERELNEAQRTALKMHMEKQRAELLRKWGQGSSALADARIREATGQSLDEALEDIRRGTLVTHYLRQKVNSQIHVTRLDIEREYQKRYAEFNPPPVRVVHFIYARNRQDADIIDQALKQDDFKTVAAQVENSYRRNEQGLWGEVKGDVLFGTESRVDPRDQAMVNLKAGEHSDRIEVRGQFWWVYVESITQEASQPLTSEVQLKLRDEIYNARRSLLQNKFESELFDSNGFDAERLGRIEGAILEVAVSRYARPQ